MFFIGWQGVYAVIGLVIFVSLLVWLFAIAVDRSAIATKTGSHP